MQVCGSFFGGEHSCLDALRGLWSETEQSDFYSVHCVEGGGVGLVFELGRKTMGFSEA